MKKAGERVKQAGRNVGEVAMDWLTIPRQLKYLACAMIVLGFAYLAVKLVSLLRR